MSAISPAQIFCVGDIADTENLRRRYRRHIYASTAKMCDTFASSCESGLSRMIASLKKNTVCPGRTRTTQDFILRNTLGSCDAVSIQCQRISRNVNCGHCCVQSNIGDELALTLRSAAAAAALIGICAISYVTAAFE